jgi:hypothetical protein
MTVSGVYSDTYTRETGGVAQRGGHVRGEQRARGRGARQRVRTLVRRAAAPGSVFAYRCNIFILLRILADSIGKDWQYSYIHI